MAEFDMTGKTSETELWKGKLGRKWAEHYHQFDQILAPLAGHLIEAARLSEIRLSDRPKNILDIGCGSGAISLQARNMTDHNSNIVAVDISEAMLQTAKKRAANLQNISFVLSDMNDFVAKQAFDLAISRLGVMSFPDPTATFARIRDMLTPTGRLVFICWQEMSRNQWALLPFIAAMDQLAEAPAPTPPGTPGPFAFADPELIHGILTASNWHNIAISEWHGQLEMESAEINLAFGPVARLIQEHDLDSQTIKAKLIAKWQELGLGTAKGAKLDAACWLVQATP